MLHVSHDIKILSLFKEASFNFRDCVTSSNEHEWSDGNNLEREDARILGCDTVCLGEKFQTFQ